MKWLDDDGTIHLDKEAGNRTDSTRSTNIDQNTNSRPYTYKGFFNYGFIYWVIITAVSCVFTYISFVHISPMIWEGYSDWWTEVMCLISPYTASAAGIISPWIYQYKVSKGIHFEKYTFKNYILAILISVGSIAAGHLVMYLIVLLGYLIAIIAGVAIAIAIICGLLGG